MARLANALDSRLNTIVVDRTGLVGRFDFEFQFLSPSLSATGDTDVQLTSGSVLTTLQEQLGLTLQTTRSPIDML
jgi:uncharacterized protein (TIGR03435 family)